MVADISLTAASLFEFVVICLKISIFAWSQTSLEESSSKDSTL